MFRETRLGVKVGSHQECELKNPQTSVTQTTMPLLLWFFFFLFLLVWLFSVSLELAIFRVLQFPYFLICDLSGGLQIKAIQRLKQDIRYPTFPRGAPLGHINPFP